ncbi:MAG: hypothetical protein A2016_05675 [Elusimicrobia bacterium GWF2_62_30]|nr:MAG: hypothetical protein A2016_05675 [Elusimicrobia bacterium GWF2_62_30]
MKKQTAVCLMEPLEINLFADKIIERCVRKRLGLNATMRALLRPAALKMKAAAIAVETLNEELKRELFFWGMAPGFDLEKTPSRVTFPASRGLRWVARPLWLDGKRVGTVALGYRGAVRKDKNFLDCLDAFCEELDNTLWNIQSAAVKQKLMEHVTRCLTRSVLREAIDDAVKALHTEIPFRYLGLVYRNEDAREGERIQYRIYRGIRCVHDSELRPHKGLSRAISGQGIHLLDPDRHVVRSILGLREGMGFVLSGKAAGASQLGKLVAEVDGGLSTFGRDLMQIFANSISQRLIDYNRERRHMAQFFPPETVSELLGDTGYARKHLSARVRQVAILYVDINSFTKLCEKGLRRPDKIGDFVDFWSAEAVRIAWQNGGVFDKMVGDCVIAIFGPPFFRKSPEQCAADAVKTAREIQAFTIKMGRMPKYRGLAATIKAKGLGVGVGINLCPAAVGLFGPNQDFTAFSSGMNQTARLQSKAGFRDILVMEGTKEALEKARLAKGLRFEGPFEAEAKNVSKPLRYFKLKGR